MSLVGTVECGGPPAAALLLWGTPRPPSHQNQSCPAKVPASLPLLSERHQTQNDGANNGRPGHCRELKLQGELHLVGRAMCPGEISCSFETLPKVALKGAAVYSCILLFLQIFNLRLTWRTLS